MRLIDVKTFELHEFHGDNVPVYVILSHVWGPDEVTFADMQTGSLRTAAEKKQGFSKLAACCQQAISDEYKWAWVDTCCIDKSSSAELSEAINSMFQWYKDAAVCYVYLDDVSLPEQLNEALPSDYPSDSIYAANCFISTYRSKWFTRGWTLQELLAPQYLLFFAHNWQPFAHMPKLLPSEDQHIMKVDLTNTVSLITGIPEKYLSAKAALGQACVAQRMFWASSRNTTRAEDRAYSLLGLFDISMPILYGEGLRKAFARLQAEIMKENPDQTILAWHPTGATLYRLLAESPGDFRHSMHVAQLQREAAGSATWSSFYMTNLGLSITLPVLIPDGGEWRTGTVTSAIPRCTTMAPYERPTQRVISLSVIFLDRDSEGRPIFICRRPPSWAFSEVQGSATNIVLARNVMSRVESRANRSRVSNTSSSTDIVLRGMHILANETGINIESLRDELWLKDIGIDSLLSISIAGRLYEELGVANFGRILALNTVAQFRMRLSHCERLPFAAETPDASLESGLSPESVLVASIRTSSKISTQFVREFSDWIPGEIRTLFVAPDATGSANIFPVPLGWRGMMLLSSFIGGPGEYECSIREISERLVNEIKRHQPHGPYSLGGWSMGGTLAFEIARQLINSGEKVQHLVIVDDLPPLTDKPSEPLDQALAGLYSSRYIERYMTAPIIRFRAPSLRQCYVSSSIAALHKYSCEPIPSDKCPEVCIIWSKKAVGNESMTNSNHPLFPFRLRDGLGPNGWERFLDESKIQMRSVEGDHFTVIGNLWGTIGYLPACNIYGWDHFKALSTSLLNLLRNRTIFSGVGESGPKWTIAVDKLISNLSL
ncbi:conidial yellow pigment biosynthesis polyketide synthase [Cladorrhinum samala]|uniref:Conidial yellow pigment biosynthesis polyketide synthase n=1 Tax=Cladorrhinum samala TaxID=585594 RepID=A0AAV9HYU2_9PEZI|nr:conidial yellow pigment biosynthesis polyketide synthase [Cladorrhinum samala]